MSRVYNRWGQGYSRGFSLTEMAIVIGVIGVLLGGIWYMGDRAAYRVNFNQASDELNMILANARAYYAGQNSSYAGINGAQAAAQGNLKTDPAAGPLASDPATAQTSFCYYTPLLTAGGMKIFPSEMLTAGGGGNLANHPWNIAADCGGNAGSAQIALACFPSGCANGPVQIVIRYTGITKVSTCIDLVTHNSTPGTDVGLNQVLVNGATAGALTARTLPVSPATAALVCVGPPFAIDWYYNVGL